jgi:hypothetical protein
MAGSAGRIKGGIVRERGVQSRRVKAGPVQSAQRPGPPPRDGSNFWQVLAIVALVAATAGWTTVAVIALRGSPATALASPSDSFDPNASVDPNASAVADAHDVPDLEAFLPTQVNGTALTPSSVNGDSLLSDDAWSAAMTTYLTSVSKTSPDLQYASASDPNGALDLQVGVYRIAGLSADATPLRDAVISAWKGLAADVKITQLTLGGHAVTKGDYGEGYAFSYLYVKGNLVYEFDTSDETIATAALAAPPISPASSGAPSAAPASKAPSPSSSASPS